MKNNIEYSKICSMVISDATVFHIPVRHVCLLINYSPLCSAAGLENLQR